MNAEQAGAGTPVSGALAAALLAAAALLLAPGVAWAVGCGLTQTGIGSTRTITCSDAAHSNVRFIGQGGAGVTIRAPGGPATVISGTTTYPSLRILAQSNTATGNYAIILGTAGAVRLTGSGRGVSIDMLGSAGTATVDVRSTVTIGSSTSSIGEHGIRVRGGPNHVTVTNAGTIYANYEGIDAHRQGAGTLTVTHTGAITSTSSTNSPGMLLVTQGAGPMLVTTSGDVTATTSTQRGIGMRAEGNGAMTLTATGGTITSSAEGVHIESRGTGDVTIRGTAANAETRSGPTITSSGSHGIEVYKTSAATAGNISITTTGGSITGQGGNGIRAHWQTYAAGNGGISVTVGAGASVTGSSVGVYVANGGSGLMVARKYTPGYGVGIESGEDPGELDELVAAMDGEGGSAVALRNQLVTVRGTVTGGTGAAVYLSGGGGVLVLEGGKVRAGSSGLGIAGDGPMLVYIDGEVRGGAGGAAAVNLPDGGSVTIGLHGRVLANGADYAIRGDEATDTTTVTLIVAGLYREDAADAVARVKGSVHGIDSVHLREEQNGKATGYYTPPFEPPVTMLNTLDFSALPSAFSLLCEAEGAERCRMYEALPSMLLALNALPSWAERSSATRDAKGGWARVEVSRGEWRAKKATTAAKLAYDHRWVVARAGMDFAPREDLRVGWSVHAPRGKAEMSGVGEVELDGVGAGVSATWRSGDLYVDAQAAVTRYGVGLTSDTQGKLLEKDASGVGYALGVEGGKRMPVGEAFVTPRAGLAWSDVDLDFTDMETAGDPELRARVSVQDARSVKGRVGVMVEKEVETGAASGRVFGSLDVEHEFSDETEVKVGERMLKTEVRPTAVSLGAGAVFEVREDVLLRVVAGYRASGGGTSGYRGGLEVQVRF